MKENIKKWLEKETDSFVGRMSNAEAVSYVPIILVAFFTPSHTTTRIIWFLVSCLIALFVIFRLPKVEYKDRKILCLIAAVVVAAIILFLN